MSATDTESVSVATMHPSANIVQGRRIQAARFTVVSLLTCGST